MYKIILILVMGMFCMSVAAQNSIYFNNRISLPNRISGAVNIMPSDSGKYFISGTSIYNTAEITTAFVDSLGQLQNYNIVGLFNHDMFAGGGQGGSSVRTSDGGYILVGTGDDLTNNDEDDIFLWRYNADGDTLWTKRFIDNPLSEYGYQVRQTADGGFALIGTRQVSATDLGDVVLIRTDSLGNTLWQRTFGGSQRETGFSIDITPDGGFILGAQTRSFGSGATDAWIIKTDSLGIEEWSQTYGGVLGDCPPRVLMHPQGGYIFAWCNAIYLYFGNSLIRPALTRIDSVGNIIWNKNYSNPRYTNILFSPSLLPDGSVLAVLNTQLNATTGDHYEIWKFNAQGDSLWGREYYLPTLPNINTLRDLRHLPDKGFVASGWVTDINGQDMWVFRADSCGYTHGIGPPPQATFAFSSAGTSSFQFQNQSQDACRYYWSFGDGNTSTLLNPQHTYPGPGTYTVQLVSCAADRCDTTSQQVTVYPCGSIPGDTLQPTAAMQITPGSTNGSFAFTSQSTNYCSLLWLFGDGNTSTAQNPQHQYQQSGTYTVTHIALRGALADTVTQQVTVQYPCGMAPADTLQPVADMTITGLSTGTFSFHSQSTNYCSLLWLFGDGNTSTTQNPQHTYQTNGSFTVTHIAFYGTQADTVLKQVIVEYPCNTAPADTLQPLAAMQITPLSAGSYSFTSQSSEYCTLLWHFGDGDTDTTANPQHTYQQSGTYTVMHIATAGALADTVTHQLSVILSAAEQASRHPFVALYPNPAQSEVTVKWLSLETATPAELLLYDALGRLTYRQLLHQQETKVKLTNLARGLYLYWVQVGQKVQSGNLELQ